MMHLHNKKFDPFENGRKWFKGETQITYPNTPAAPSTAESIDAWVKSMPAVFAEQQRQAPLEAQQQVQLAQQYAQPLALAYKSAQESLYPGTSAIQETEANQALQGMTATKMPDWMSQNYQSDFNANIGTNAGSPIGADYVSRGMQQQLFEQQKYYRDLGLSLAGRQPLSQPTTPATNNYASTFTPQAVMNSQNQNYSTFAQASRPFASQPQPLNLGWLGSYGVCWVAAEVLGGWTPQTVRARHYMLYSAPAWLRNFYVRNGEQIAEFIHDKPFFKAILKPLFRGRS